MPHFKITRGIAGGKPHCSIINLVTRNNNG